MPHFRIICWAGTSVLLAIVILVTGSSGPSTATASDRGGEVITLAERAVDRRPSHEFGVDISPSSATARNDVPSCIGDITGPDAKPDGAVDVLDLLHLLGEWGPCDNPADCPADLTGPDDEPDGVVDVLDLLKLLGHWGPCPTGACCLDNGECEQRNAVECHADDGEFHGQDTSCENVECDVGIVCPDGATDEDEPCGEATNDGCNVDPPTFGPELGCGDTVCGTAWAEGGERDRDWFPITISEPTKITWSVEAAFPAQLFIVNDQCGDQLFVHAGAEGDSELTVSACLPPGDYRLMITVDDDDDFPCGTANDYVASVSCESCVPAGQSCDDPIFVPVDGGPVMTSTAGREVADIPDCIGFDEGTPISPSVWFEVTGTGEELMASTCGSDLATGISVLCTSCDDLTCVAGNTSLTEHCMKNPFATDVTFCSEPGETYYIVVWSMDAVPEGPVTMQVTSEGESCEPEVSCAPPAQCAGYCGGQSPDGCWCDDFVCDFAPELCCPGVCLDCPQLDQCDSKGSCAGVPCGQQSPDGCWCDEDCGGFDDCCEDVCDECPDFAQCQECSAIDCEDNVGEDCGENINGGCNSSPPQFSTISCGAGKCGNLWAADGTRDLDWFELTIDEPSVVTWSVEAEAEINAFVTNGECGNDEVIIELDSGCSPSVSTCLSPGTYYLVVSPTQFEGHPCPGFTYHATVTCEGSSDCPFGSCAGACGGGSPPGCNGDACDCWCDDECVAFGDCCDDVCIECPDLDFCDETD